MHYECTPRGVCASHLSFDIEDGKLQNVVFTGGCNGNLKAIGLLVEGRDAAGMVILLVELEVLVEMVDALRQQRDLHLGRTGIALVPGILLDDFLFGHGFSLHYFVSPATE